MPFNIEQDKFLIEAYFRSGEKIAGIWMYDIRKCHSEFYNKFPEEEQIVYDVFAQYVRRLISRFNSSGSVCKNTPRRKASKVTDEWLRNLEEILKENPAYSVRQIANLTGLSYGSCQKALQLLCPRDREEMKQENKEIISYFRI